MIFIGRRRTRDLRKDTYPMRSIPPSTAQREARIRQLQKKYAKAEGRAG
jgi:hypothetical protein